MGIVCADDSDSERTPAVGGSMEFAGKPAQSRERRAKFPGSTKQRVGPPLYRDSAPCGFLTRSVFRSLHRFEPERPSACWGGCDYECS